MASPALNEELLSLHYYARQQCSRQWVHFMAAMFSEFEERVTSAEANQFLEALGAKMARLLPLRRCESLQELEEDINSVLEGIDWGWMRLREADYLSRSLTALILSCRRTKNGAAGWCQSLKDFMAAGSASRVATHRFKRGFMASTRAMARR